MHFTVETAKLSFSENVTIQQFVSELLLLSYTSINHTLVLRAQDLKKDFKYLQESIDNRLTHFFSALLIQLNHSEINTSVILDEIINGEEYKLLPNHPSETKITHIYKKLTGKGLDKYSIEQLTKSYEEQYENTIEDFAKLYQQIQTLIYDLAALRSIVPNEKIEVDEVNLFKYANGLIITAAERFYKDRPEALPPIAERGSFIQLAEQHAIEHFGVVDRSKGKNNPLENTNAGTTSIFSFFWSPISNMIYGPPSTPVTTPNNEEATNKKESTSSFTT